MDVRDRDLDRAERATDRDEHGQRREEHEHRPPHHPRGDHAPEPGPPALLAVIGTNINRWRIPLPKRWRRRTGFWRVVAKGVMRHPAAVLVPTLALLVVAGRPFLDLEIATPDIHVLPAARRVPPRPRDPPKHLPGARGHAHRGGRALPGRPARHARTDRRALRLSRRLAAVPGVDRVESVVDAYRGWSARPCSDAGGRRATRWPDPLAMVAHETVGAQHRGAVRGDRRGAGERGRRARSCARSAPSARVADGELLVTGQTAMDLDSAVFIRAHVPAAVGFVVAMTMLVLFLLLGSVVLPIKAVVMNLLSITGSFGALVWIFQQGHLHSLLRLHAAPIEPSLPVVLFCASSGSRWTTRCCCSRASRRSTSARATTRTPWPRGSSAAGPHHQRGGHHGGGVRGVRDWPRSCWSRPSGSGWRSPWRSTRRSCGMLLVPATMRLFGRLNWWAPGPLARLQRRLWGSSGADPCRSDG